ncbi:MAG: hypothetical protein ACRDAX_00230 [Propionibacteriaceae bacterium]
MADTDALEEVAMRRAIELASCGSIADRNPRVGCVFLQHGTWLDKDGTKVLKALMLKSSL